MVVDSGLARFWGPYCTSSLVTPTETKIGVGYAKMSIGRATKYSRHSYS